MREIHGKVEEQFEPVRRLFASKMSMMAEDEAQLCVYVGEKKVVDLWAADSQNNDFNADTLVNIFSSGKSLESIAIALLAEKGLLNYHTKIVEYWPEFASGGKEDITIADLMRHEAGLPSFNVSIPPEFLHRDNLKQNKIGEIIAEHPAAFQQDEKYRREYHALTRGWIANEIVRRVHPDGKTIGEILEEEVFVPLDVDVRIGLSEQELDRVSPVKLLSLKQHFRHTFRPDFLGRKVKHNTLGLMRNLMPMVSRARRNGGGNQTPPFTGMETMADLGNLFNNPIVRQGETPSANAHASARGLARLGAMLAAQGSLGDQQIMGQQAWNDMHAHPVSRFMMLTTHFSQGGVNRFQLPATSSHIDRSGNKGREGFWGWMGLGGSIFQWHPEHKIGFGFVPTRLHALDFMNERGKAFQAEVMKCVAQI
ncbi:MAG: beta-lactamase family protein [Pseudomonadales bacterium]|nr:beta-lactamase family protein [Pseudomonadales bacterium]MBO6700984.1 beta-lactamase family protein [Pseudomonadales bacterium]MBO7005803.1 beta-lactamase family protein [Pseudomonadales bacterium]